MVPRRPLFDFISQLPVNQCLVQLLTAWHDNTTYVVTQGQTEQAVRTTRGVRQGCRSAPILWSCCTLDLFYRLSNKVDALWVQKCLTAFADDLHCCETFYSESQLQAALHRIGILLDTLEDLGISLSLSKSLVIIQICGTNKREVTKRTVKIGSDGPYILIPRIQGEPTKLPVKMSATYLGVQVGYKLFETNTVHHRLQSARTTFSRLRRWLCARQIPMKARIQMWKSCVLSTMLYGIYAVGFTLPDVLQLQHCIFNMYRKIVGDHSYITRNTHYQILQQFALEHPLQLILNAGHQLRHTLSHRLSKLTTDDILLTIDWTHIQQLQQLVTVAWQEQLQAQMTMPATEAPPLMHVCQFCNKRFNTLPNLRRHQTTEHGLTQLRTNMAVVASYAVRGLPQCSRCMESFPSWRNFLVHLERNCCQAFPRQGEGGPTRPELPSQQADLQYPLLTEHNLTQLLSKPYGVAVLDCIKDRQWCTLQQYPTALADLTSYCVICGVYCGRPQELNLHIRTQHQTLLPHVMCKASQLCRSQASNSPCRFCSRSFRRTHQCPVMTQSALILVNTDSTGQTYEQPGQTVLRCDVCGQQFQELREVHAHIHSQHRLEPQDWDPLRDQFGSDPVCSHCMALFTDRAAVRQHITLGQCLHFNPLKPPSELPVPAEWQELIQLGDTSSLRQAPMRRLALTLRCQFCQTSINAQEIYHCTSKQIMLSFRENHNTWYNC